MEYCTRLRWIFRCRTLLVRLLSLLPVFLVPDLFAAEAVLAERKEAESETHDRARLLRREFQTDIKPLLRKACFQCHDEDSNESGIRVDRLEGDLEEADLKLWTGIHRQVNDRKMPPEDEVPLSDRDRSRLLDWIDRGLRHARSRPVPRNGAFRRLTVSQYRNSLRDLLGIETDFSDLLPPDAVSKDGFLNSEETMLLSPLLLEACFEIADAALERCLVDPTEPPVIQNFRMDLGAGINKEPCPDSLILGALSRLLANEDFQVIQLQPNKPFEYRPFRMQTRYRFIEGYRGNDTVRGWREYDSIYHAVFACMRGSFGYPKGLAYQSVPAGLLLRPAIPSAELFQVESTYGPRANFKVSLRELPDRGHFRITVRAARYEDGLLLDPGTKPAEESSELRLALPDPQQAGTVILPTAGIYQVDLPPGDNKRDATLTLTLGDRVFSGKLHGTAFLMVRLPKGEIPLSIRYSGDKPLQRLILTGVPEESSKAERFRRFESRVPYLGVHMGLRRDCGSTLTRVGQPVSVSGTELQDYVFEGAIENYPSPDVEKDNVNYLAGIREIGVRSEYTDGRDRPRLLIRSVEFEGPYFEQWPPRTHRQIFIDSEHEDEPAIHAREILQRFGSRAFRRPLKPEQLDRFHLVWKRSFREGRTFQQSVRDALLVILTSPQFLFLIETSETPAAEPIDDWELASKLSYFLWNTAPDERLVELAREGQLRNSLDDELERMIADTRFHQFATEFTSQWLNLEKFDVVEIDRGRFPELTRDVRTQLRGESAALFEYLVRQNLPVRHLVDSEFIMANEVVADYYGLADQSESGFQFKPVLHGRKQLGGLLTQASFLSGLSDGREANPVKRGAWLARKIVAEPPDDPPPNVPELDDSSDQQLTLREKLSRHRDQKGCAQCHARIDPWGLPFEQYDASGRFRAGVSSPSTLPDGTEVADVAGLKRYLVAKREDQVVFSVLKHLLTYAVGRPLNYNEIEFLRSSAVDLKDRGLRDLVRFTVFSETFLTK